jgi:hypothetical protein
MQPANSTLCLLDQDIREALKNLLRGQDNTAAIIDELPLMRGRGRADLAFVNGELWGFEIKSEGDSLVRLGVQRANYEDVFEFNTLVAVRKHLRLARQRIPRTWGIIEAKRINGKIELLQCRQAQRNHSINNSALARLLWKNECRYVLRGAQIHTDPHTPVIELWNLIQSLDSKHLCTEVREALKRRQAKAAPQRTLYDDSHTIVATE